MADELKTYSPNLTEYQSKSVKILAMLWTGQNREEVKGFLGDKCRYINNQDEVAVRTSNGQREVRIGDFIVEKADGRFCVMSRIQLEKAYEKVGE